MKKFCVMLLGLAIVCATSITSAATPKDEPQQPTKLSVKIEDEAVTAPVPLAENKALDGESSPLSKLASAASDQFQEGYKEQPLLWTLAISIMGFFGVKAGTNKVGSWVAKLSQYANPAEIAGIGVACIGVMGVTNAAAHGFGWSYITPNLIVGSLLTGIIGIGIACDAENAKKK